MSDTTRETVATEFANLMAQENTTVVQADVVITPELKKLVGDEEKKAAGSFVLTGQEVAAKEGFKNVSKIWYKKTLSYGEGLDLLEQGRAVTEDILATVKEMVPAVVNGNFVLRYKDGRSFQPTSHAVTQMGNWADTGTWYVNSLLTNPKDAKERVLYSRDSGDAETLAVALRNGFRRLEQDKKFLFRTRQDGTLRAMLTERFAIIDNRWFIEKLSGFIPDGRLSHWRGDSDTLWGNILIPDTIREEKDSDYGGMLSVGNSEIGERRVSSVPSIFRAICMNGCIWGATKGEGIRQVHRGKIDLDYLAKEIQVNLNKQIPLLPVGIEKLLGTQALAWDGVSLKPVYAQLAKDFKLSKKQATGVLAAALEERSVTPEFARTLFGVTNAVTRAGQKLGNADWVRFDELGGELIRFDKDDFSNLVSRAARLKEKDVDEVFAAVAA